MRFMGGWDKNIEREITNSSFGKENEKYIMKSC